MPALGAPFPWRRSPAGPACPRCRGASPTRRVTPPRSASGRGSLVRRLGRLAGAGGQLLLHALDVRRRPALDGAAQARRGGGVGGQLGESDLVVLDRLF